MNPRELWRGFLMVYEYAAYVSRISVLKSEILKALEFINWQRLIKKDSRVFVKPNFTFPYYKEGVTTSPSLLKDLLEIIKHKSDTIVVGENHSFSADST
jgi:uncharacterized protein (DUF362 family)